MLDYQGLQKGVEDARLLQKYSVEVSVLTPDETLEKAPSLHFQISGGIFFPGDAHLDPGKFVKGLAENLMRRGVQIISRTKVLKLEKSTESVTNVITTQGNFRPTHVVLAAGAWSGKLVQGLGFRLAWDAE